MATTTESAAAGKSIAGYTITRREPLERLEGAYLELTHERTGARHIHIECPDDNNGFAVFFPTAPTDSTGVAHILEHVVLAGSRRYPVHDPFFSMTRRSLATFMNALTGSDWTMYLFSTRNAKDYRNLLDVYLDATFFPKLAEDSFKQEGVRFEYEDPTDPNSGLRYKGVVFNEMKGALATPGSAVSKAIGKTLFPGLPYAHISGGDPQDIPNLTWENLKRFHARHYHPSNARFYTYGNQPLEKTLHTIEDNALSKFDRITPDRQIPDVKRFAKPTSGVGAFPAPSGDTDTKLAEALTAWVTIPTASSFRLLAMKVLAEVLLGNAGSPLRKALIDSGLGSALADGSGFHDDYKESVFGAGLKGIVKEDAEKVQDVVLQTLERIAEGGLDESQVDAAIHHLEFEKREKSNAGFPYALRVLFTLHPAYLYEGDPLKALEFDNDLEHLQKARQEGRFFENLIRAELLDNPHRALVTVVPDPDMEDRQRKQELDRLAQIEKQLTDEDRNRILEDALRLKQEQDARQDLSILPTLELDDIPMKFEDVPSRDAVAAQAVVEFYPQPTNGITYLDLRADFRDLTQEQKDLLPLFGRVLTQSGAAGQDYAEIASRIASHTGGVGAAAQVQSLAAQEDYIESFVLSGKALDRNAQPFIELLTDLTARLEIEPRRLKETIAEIATRLESSLASLGFSFALLRAHAKISSEGALNDRLQGIGMLHTMRRLARLDQTQLGGVIDALNGIRHDLFRTGALRIIVTCEESMIGRLGELITGLVAALPQDGALKEGPRPPAEPNAPEARTAPVPVAFNVRFFKTVRYTHADAPALLVLANYLRDTFLHRELREKGGAYGGFASAGIVSGTFYLGSYRDPNIIRTYDVFDHAVIWVTEHDIEADSLKEAILGASGDVDPLESPDIKGRREATNRATGLTREARERFKQRLLQVTADDLRRVTRTYLVGARGVQSTVAGPDLVEAARKENPRLFEVVAPL
ncbi:MAG TPA: insulinase family protein [Candidatus Dormibacteraeota bacterium]|nr:insulinase family protein [Candidatus Dormibacteraeota bacterium]